MGESHIVDTLQHKSEERIFRLQVQSAGLRGILRYTFFLLFFCVYFFLNTGLTPLTGRALLYGGPLYDPPSLQFSEEFS